MTSLENVKNAMILVNYVMGQILIIVKDNVLTQLIFLF